MRSVNKVILIGNITRDPELKKTTSGQSIVTFGLATNREWVTSKGEKHSLAEYHNLVAWGKLAEICHQYLKKGKLIYVEGYLKTRSWDSPEGVKIFKTEVVIYDMIMLEKRPKEEEEAVTSAIGEPSEEEEEEFIPEADDIFDPLADISPEEKSSEKATPKEEKPEEEAK